MTGGNAACEQKKKSNIGSFCHYKSRVVYVPRYLLRSFFFLYLLVPLHGGLREAAGIGESVVIALEGPHGACCHEATPLPLPPPVQRRGTLAQGARLVVGEHAPRHRGPTKIVSARWFPPPGRSDAPADREARLEAGLAAVGGAGRGVATARGDGTQWRLPGLGQPGVLGLGGGGARGVATPEGLEAGFNAGGGEPG